MYYSNVKVLNKGNIGLNTTMPHTLLCTGALSIIDYI